MMERIRGFLWSATVHAGLCALVVFPWSGWVRERELSSAASVAELSHYVPMPVVTGDPPAEKSTVCRREPCIGEGPQPKPPETVAPQGEELDFLDDMEHALLPALRRAGGWIAIVSRTDRLHALAFYRVADGKNLGAGMDLAHFPLRVLVREPESYPEIVRWLVAIGSTTELLRTVAIFPPQTQQRLHDEIEVEAKRTGLPPGPRRAVVAISTTETMGIAVRSVVLRPEITAKRTRLTP